MNECLGYDCDGNEIYEYRILRAIWSNDFDIEELEDADPRLYCAIVGDDGKAYAISVFDWWNKELIEERENISEGIPIIVKPIEEMVNYEVAVCNDGKSEFYYELDRNKLREQLKKILNQKRLTKKRGE